MDKYGSYASWRAVAYFIFILLLAFFLDLPAAKSAIAATQAQAETLIRLEDLEQMALQGNPTLAQAEAAVRAAEGRRVQAGLFPNPIMGYSGEELALRAIGQKSEHLLFFEQSIPLGGKLKKSRNIIVQEKAQAEHDMAAQRQRILNAVRVLYYEALGAQQLVEVRELLARLAGEAVGVTGELFNVGQADRPDLFQIEIEAQRAQLDLIVAENDRDQVWQQLAAVVGNPFLKRSRLMGDLERDLPVIDQEAILAKLLKDSPEILRARAGAERAKAAVTRAKAEPAPDLFVRMALGYNLEQLDSTIVLNGRRTGPEGQLEVGMRVPIFNRNQGAIAAAGAEVDAAEREVLRVELMLRARFASALRSYQNALRVTAQYEKQIIPRAQQAYDMYLGSFKQMAAAYPQVLIAQRTLFQVRADYIKALVDAWQNATQMQGYLLMGGLAAPGDAGE